MKDTIEGENTKRGREEQDLNIMKEGEMHPVKKEKVECEEGITLHSEVEETRHKWSQSFI